MLQAFVFPPFTEGCAQVRFWLYWIGHTQVIGSGAYVVAAMGYRPKVADVKIAAGAILLYNAVILPINVVLGWDYGYVGPETTVVGWLGPWPWRVMVLVALELLAFVILWLPWRRSTQVTAPA